MCSIRRAAARRPRTLLGASALALAAPLAAALAPAEPLEPGGEIERSLTPGESAVFALRAATGQLLRVEIEQRGLDVRLRLLDAAGTTLASRDTRSGPYGRETLSWIAAATGELRVEVAPFNPERHVGRFAIELVERRAATADDRRRVEAENGLHVALAGPGSAAGVPWAEAVARVERSAALYRELGDRRGEGLAQHRRSILLRDAGDLAGAQLALTRAIAAFHAAGDGYQEGIAWIDLGTATATAGDQNRAERELEEALALVGGGAYPALEAELRVTLSWAHFQRGRLQEAIDEATLALELASGRAIETEAFALNHRGYFRWFVGDYEGARADLERALPAALAVEATEGWVSGFVFANLAWSHWQLGEPERARAFAERALLSQRRRGDGYGETLSRVALASFDVASGRVAAAEAQLRDTLALAQRVAYPLGEFSARMGLAAAESARADLAAARATLREAARFADGAGNPEWQAAAHGALASNLADAGELDAARHEIEAAVERLELLRGELESRDLRLLFFASRASYYELWIELLMRLHARRPDDRWDEAAFAASERAHARGLLDELRAAGGTQASAAPRPAAPTLAELRRDLLDERTLLLEYALGEERSFLWIVGRASFRSVELPARAELERRIDRFRELLAAPDRRAAERAVELAAAELGRLLLAGASGLGAERLAVVPSGALARLPFAALRLPADGATAGAPLVARHELVQLPSAAVLRELRAAAGGRRPARRALAVLADPVYGADDERLGSGRAAATPRPGAAAAGRRALDRLDASAAESERLAALVRPGEGFVATGFAARRDALARSEVTGARILHFATHAVADERSPGSAAVVLSNFDAQGRALDGRLGRVEIQRLELDAELVVLGACRTAAGPELRGEGTLSLARAFLHRGVPRVVAALWDVDDDATARLMESFYRGLLGESLRPAEALRGAQLELAALPRFRHPVFWSAFVLEGDWR